MTDPKNGTEHTGAEQQPAAGPQDHPAAPVTEEPSAAPTPEQPSDAVKEEPAVAEHPTDATAASAPTVSGGQSKEADALWASLRGNGVEPSRTSGSAISPEASAAPEAGSETGPVQRPEPDFVLGEPRAEQRAEVREDEPYLIHDEEEDSRGSESAASGKSAAGAKKAAAKKETSKTRGVPSGPFGGKSFGPVILARPLMKDEDGNLVPTPPTIASRLFTGLSLMPIILPLVLLVAQVAFTLDVRSLWYSDEVRYANAFQNMVQTGNWLTLQLNGAVYPDKPPLFFWLLQGISDAAAQVLPGGIAQPMLFFAGVAVSGLLCLLAAHALASLVGRVDRRTVLAADLILLSGFFFAGLLHYLRMDLLFAACITFSHVLLFHAWVREKAPLLMLLGFLMAGVAVLVKGPLGFAFPLLAGICFLLWQGRIGRFFRIDTIFGIIAGLAVPGAWLILAWMNLGDGFLNNILYKQVLARALDTWHHAEPWYHYLVTFPAIWLPWTLLLLFLPWGRLFGKGMREGLKASRTKDGAGMAYMWCAFLPGFILLSAVSIKLPIYCLPLFPPLAVICARAVMQMRPLAAACLQYTFAVLLAVLGLSLMLTPIVPLEMLRLPLMPQGTIITGGVCLVFACALGFLVRPRRAEGLVLLMALFTTAFSFPAWAIVAPSLDPFLSPRAQAEVVKTYRDAGYFPASFKVYPGTYSYYGGNVLVCESWEETLDVAKKNEKTVLALRASFWDKLENKPEGFAEVNRQIIAERAYVLVARPPLGGVKDAVAEQPETAAVPAAESVPAPEQKAEEAAQPAAATEQPAATPEQPAVTDAAPQAETVPEAAQPVTPEQPASSEQPAAQAAPAS